MTADDIPADRPADKLEDLIIKLECGAALDLHLCQNLKTVVARLRAEDRERAAGGDEWKDL